MLAHKRTTGIRAKVTSITLAAMILLGAACMPGCLLTVGVSPDNQWIAEVRDGRDVVTLIHMDKHTTRTVKLPIPWEPLSVMWLDNRRLLVHGSKETKDQEKLKKGIKSVGLYWVYDTHEGKFTKSPITTSMINPP